MTSEKKKPSSGGRGRNAKAAVQARWAKRDAGEMPTAQGAEHFSARLRWARLRAGLSQRDFGTSAPAVGRLENGHQEAGIRTAEQLAKVLKVNAEWLVFGLGVPAPRSSKIR